MIVFQKKLIDFKYHIYFYLKFKLNLKLHLFDFYCVFGTSLLHKFWFVFFSILTTLYRQNLFNFYQFALAGFVIFLLLYLYILILFCYISFFFIN